MPKREDIKDKRFGMLKILEYVHTRNGKAYWLCRCDCKNEKIIDGASIRNEDTKSCGCYRSMFFMKHGMSRTKTYQSWSLMKQRCLNPKNDRYKNYGGRGITFCKRWSNFKNFLEDMGEKPKGLTLERINNNGNYEPSNCKWATPKEQSNNMRRNVLIKFRGKTGTISYWAEKMNIERYSLGRRLRAGWSVKRALTTPLN